MGIFAEKTQGFPPSYLVKKAYLHMPANKDNLRILDLGTGSFRNSLFFAKKGIPVLAIDKDKDIYSYYKKLQNGAELIEPACKDICEFMSENKEKFLGILAIHVIPFLPEKCREMFFKKLPSILTKEGVLALTFWGPKDDFSTKGVVTMSLDDLLEKLKPLEVVFTKEKEYDGPTINGWQKHWHIINVLARNPK